MADKVAGKLQLLSEFFESDDDVLHTGGLRHVLQGLSISIANGTSDGQADLIYTKRDSVGASATDVFDLAGVLTDAVGGDVITGAEVVALIVVNRSTTSGDNLKVGPDATNGCVAFWADASDRNLVQAGITNQPGFVVLYAPRGYAITGGSADEFAVTELGGVNTVSYDILILLRSA